MFELHYWILVELRVDLSLIANEHPCLVIALSRWQALEIQSAPTFTILDSLLTNLSRWNFTSEPKHLIRLREIFIALFIGLKLSLHCIILGFLINLFNLITPASSREPLMGKHAINFFFHSSFLFFTHLCAATILLCIRSDFCRGLSSFRAWHDISRQLDPSKILRPLVDIKREFKAHIRR